MNHLKAQAIKDKLDHFLTYADNFAIGYFSKQVGLSGLADAVVHALPIPASLHV